MAAVAGSKDIDEVASLMLSMREGTAAPSSPLQATPGSSLDAPAVSGTVAAPSSTVSTNAMVAAMNAQAAAYKNMADSLMAARTASYMPGPSMGMPHNMMGMPPMHSMMPMMMPNGMQMMMPMGMSMNGAGMSGGMSGVQYSSMVASGPLANLPAAPFGAQGRYHPYQKPEYPLLGADGKKQAASPNPAMFGPGRVAFNSKQATAPSKTEGRPDKPHTCTHFLADGTTVCGRSFNKLVHLKAHIRTHTGERPFVCTHPDCNKSFTQLATLKNHLATHKQDKPFPCATCDRTFARRSALTQHEQTHLGEGRQVFSCTVEGCDKVFTQQSSLRAHLRIHTGEKPFVCPVTTCRRAFSRRSNLKRHVLTHPNSGHPAGELPGTDDSDSQSVKSGNDTSARGEDDDVPRSP